MQSERKYLKILRMKRAFYLVLISVCWMSCTHNPLKVNVSNVSVDLKIKHFEVDLLNHTNDSASTFVPELKKKYGDFFDIFTYRMISIGGVEQANFQEMLHSFISDTLIQNLKVKVAAKVDTVGIRKDLELAFKHYKYYFPQKQVPEIVTCISGFNQSVVTSANLVGISLDKYMGSDCRYYERLGLPAYKRRNMHQAKITTDVIYAWALTEYPIADNVTTLLGKMIYEGKLMYFVDAMTPELNDTLKMGISQKQLDFCRKNEASMWTFMAEHKLLYTTDRMSIKGYIDDGPYTASFTSESPARTGVWLGWQIVRSYMKNHPDVKLADLMNIQDHQSILNQSGYQP